MKRLLNIVGLMVMLIVTPLAAQTDTGTVVIPRSALTEAQKASLASIQLQEKAQAYGAWVGVGKEIGEAVNSSLSAIGDNANKFADTKAGKLTIYLVIWKVVGDDILGLLYAFAIAFIGLPIVVWSYKKHIPLTVLNEEIVDDKGKVSSRKYRTLKFDEHNDRTMVLFFHAIAAGILLIAASVAIFG